MPHYGETRTLLFVTERLSRQIVEAANSGPRTNKFFVDARLPRSERAELSDDKGSGYARGRQHAQHSVAMAQTFSLANMVPQEQRENSGPLSKIEQDRRRYAASAQGYVFFITGPVFGPGRRTAERQRGAYAQSSSSASRTLWTGCGLNYRSLGPMSYRNESVLKAPP